VRPNQKRRTRKDLLQAAATLMKQGRRPSLDEVAEEALVSRATAYRYFPSIDALLAEASADMLTPEPAQLFTGDEPTDPVARVEKVDAALHDMVLANESALRLMLANALQQGTGGERDAGLPLRQNRRTPLIEAALEPVRKRLGAASFDRLVRALALVIGTEGAIVFKDVLELDDHEAKAVRQWMIGALVGAALQDAKD